MSGHAWKFPTSIAPHDLDLLSEALGIAPADGGRANGMVSLWDGGGDGENGGLMVV